jgi:hypothetical protein
MTRTEFSSPTRVTVGPRDSDLFNSDDLKPVPAGASGGRGMPAGDGHAKAHQLKEPEASPRKALMQVGQIERRCGFPIRRSLAFFTAFNHRATSPRRSAAATAT